MKPEQKVWQQIRPMLDGFVTRIENSTTNGMPDVVQIRPGSITNWIELKAAETSLTPPLLRKEQYAWMTRASMSVARCFVIAGEIDRCFGRIWMFPIKVESVGNAGKYVRIKSLHDFSFGYQEDLNRLLSELFRLRTSKL